MSRRRPVSLREIAAFWAPLAATWLMMALENPFLAAVIARLADPKHNLAAYGVAFAIAILVEAPVIMMMSAATALVDSGPSYRRLRNFTYALNAGMTILQALLVLTPLYGPVMEGLIGLDPEVARLTRTALLLLLPWPGAIGYRRFYQGVMIRQGQTRRVAYGTVVRLATMATTGLLLYGATAWPGAAVGAAALSAGVCAEAAASRLMAAGAVRALLREEARARQAVAAGLAGARLPAPPGHLEIARFYAPLAMTSIIALTAHPLVTFFMGRAPAALESLAVLPVVNSLTFIFRSAGLSFQEAAIALLARGERNLLPLARFAAVLAGGVSLGLGLLSWTPLADLWLVAVSGLSPELAGFALTPLRILVPVPALAVLLSLQRAMLVHDRRTDPITWATAVEVAGIGLVLLLLVGRLGVVGVVAAAVAFVAGRVGGNLVLVPPCRRWLSRRRSTGPAPA